MAEHGDLVERFRCGIRRDHCVPTKGLQTVGRVFFLESRRDPYRWSFRVEHLRRQRFVLYQAFAHAVLMVAMFYIVGAVKGRSGTSEIAAMGGFKLKTPRLAALFLLVLSNAIALPLTQSFIGEWLMFNGLWQLEGGAWMAFGAVSTIVLGAIYML